MVKNNGTAPSKGVSPSCLYMGIHHGTVRKSVQQGRVGAGQLKLGDFNIMEMDTLAKGSVCILKRLETCRTHLATNKQQNYETVTNGSRCTFEKAMTWQWLQHLHMHCIFVEQKHNR